jgi:GTP-binding protein HflX
MTKTVSTEKGEKAIVVGVAPKYMREQIGEHLEELSRLADTAGAQVLRSVVQERERIDSATYIGKGKVSEVADLVTKEEINVVIFDDDLSSVQVRNLEKAIPCKIIDRSGLILDIFASRAKSKEAMTQVELAQLQYMLPRLTRQWTHLSKQFGGIGTKGPGETQIETDRRNIRRRISALKDKLGAIEKERVVQRNRRGEHTRVALVGYTNAGKSTLLKLYSKADVFIEDRLFATLDTTVRSVQLMPGRKILLSDTVGFIRKLPPQLVASFKSTLAEVVEADILLHVVDVSHPRCLEHIEVVQKTLEELKVGDKPVIYVFNKIDLVKNRSAISEMAERLTPSVIVSAARNINISQLNDLLIHRLDEGIITGTVTIPQSEYRTISKLHEIAEIIRKEYVDNSVRIRYRVTQKNYERLQKVLGR